MSIAVWPPELVQFERSAWHAQPQEARRKRQTESGPPGYRRRFSAVSRSVGLALVVDRNGKAVFDRFYHDDCAFGARLFTMPDPATDGWRLATAARSPLVTGNGRPLLLAARWLCAFGDDPPVETILGDSGFRLTFTVIVMP